MTKVERMDRIRNSTKYKFSEISSDDIEWLISEVSNADFFMLCERQKIISETLRKASWLIDRTTGNVLRDYADGVEKFKLAEFGIDYHVCCPLCEEVDCDGDCPMKPIRITEQRT